MQSVGIEDQAKEGSRTNHGKDMIEGFAGAESVMEADFGNIVLAAIPTDSGRFYLLGSGIIGNGDGNGDIDFLGHETIYTRRIPEVNGEAIMGSEEGRRRETRVLAEADLSSQTDSFFDSRMTGILS